jgi:hypothetical protein
MREQVKGVGSICVLAGILLNRRITAAGHSANAKSIQCRTVERTSAYAAQTSVAHRDTAS